KEQLLDELYKLDYEDIIGDIPCRFKYTKVNANDFGLAPEEILLADDKDLNKYVPLKKLAPYRTDEPKLDARRRRQLREEVKEREAAAEVEMRALRSKKRRRGKKKPTSSSSALPPPPAELAVDPTGTSAATSTPLPPLSEVGGETVAGSDLAVTAELAGGKRRRRKKGQKKQRVQAGVGAGGGRDGQEEAEMVPRVQPMSAPTEGGGGAASPDAGGGPPARNSSSNSKEGDESARGNDGGSNSSSKSKKRSKKRGRVSEGDGEVQGGSQKDGMAPAGDVDTTDGDKAGQTAPAPVAGSGAVKKTRRGSSGKGG
ncbi:unnamed protein product, partial [Laminaria digitata]